VRAAFARLTRYPRLAALLCGGLAATGFEPLHLWPMGLLGLAGLIALLARCPTWKQAVFTGWLFGVGHFSIGNTWIATAFTYQAAMPAWLGVVAVILLAFYLAAFPALAGLLAWRFSRANRASLVSGLAASWILTEWLRGWLFTGFPWNPLAAIALGSFDRPGLAAALPAMGTYALSGMVVLLAGAWQAAFARDRFDWKGALLILVPVALLLMPTRPDRSEGRLTFTLVQPNIPQHELNDPAFFETSFQRLARLSAPLGPGKRLLLWPESGVPDYLREGYPDRFYLDNYGADPVLARKRLGRVAGPGSLLMTGTVDLEFRDDEVAGARNAVSALDSNGSIRGSYAKAHLVPYGEYLPMRALLTPLGLSRLVPGDVDFWPGPGPRTLDLGAWGQPGVQVCYEIIFSGQVTDRANRPEFLFNPSNDGWFGAWGPPQHLAQARLRAIEEGLPVLRATTTGISAVIDAHGVVRQFVPHGQAGRIDGKVPPAAPPTPFARLGNILALGWSGILLVLSLVASRSRAR